jgi:hypothetical protein
MQHTKMKNWIIINSSSTLFFKELITWVLIMSMLNLLGITWKCYTPAMLVIVDLWIIFYTQSDRLWFISIPDFTCLVPMVQYLLLSHWKWKEIFAWPPCCFYIPEKGLKKVAYFWMIYYHTHLHDSVIRSSSAGPTSLVRVSATFVLLITRN